MDFPEIELPTKFDLIYDPESMMIAFYNWVRNHWCIRVLTNSEK